MQRHSLKSISYANLYLVVLLGNLSVVFNPLLLELHARPILLSIQQRGNASFRGARPRSAKWTLMALAWPLMAG